MRHRIIVHVTRGGSLGLSPRAEMRILAGFAMQPVTAGVLALLLAPLHPDFGLAFFVAAAASAITVVGAFPLLLALLRYGPISRAQTLVSGACLGNLPTLLAIVLTWLDRRSYGRSLSFAELLTGPASVLRAAALGTFLGVAGASVFWLIAGSSIGVDERSSH